MYSNLIYKFSVVLKVLSIFASDIFVGYSQSSVPNYPFVRYPGIKDEDKMGLGPHSLQDMDAERTVRRARRNRTCFTRQQVCILPVGPTINDL